MANLLSELSLAVSIVGITISILANRNAARSAAAAERQARAAEAAIPSEPPPVSWIVERRGLISVWLRNIGPKTAHGVVAIDDYLYTNRSATGPVSATYQLGTIAPGQAKLVFQERLAEVHEPALKVRWDGQSSLVYLPVPPREHLF